MVSPVPTQSAAQAALWGALTAVLPAGVKVIAGQANRVPQPSGADFVVMTPIMRRRLETDGVAYSDCAFVGSIAGPILTAAAPQFGSIVLGAPVFGVNVAAGTTVTALITGTGGAGTYTVSPSQTVSSGILAAGQTTYTQPQEITWQLDFHSAAPGDAADMVAAVSTFFRSDLANTLFNSPTSGCWPLYADDPRQVPFINAEQQYETRWVLDCHCQINQEMIWPTQFLDTVSVKILSLG